MIIRAMEEHDVAAVFDLERATPEASHWPLSEYERVAGASAMAWVAEDLGEAIVGFLIARRVADEVEILNLAVSARHRRRGIGSRLVHRLMGELEAVPLARIYLEVRRSNQPAIVFYERHGFRCVGERRDYYHDPRDDAVVLALNRKENLRLNGCERLC
jgi:ribosomal-protein-alanine N-acetyltransferase